MSPPRMPRTLMRFWGRIETTPGSGGTLDRGPNHSLGISKEGYVKPTRICDFDGRTAPHLAKGLCQGHYKQQQIGQVLRPLQPKLSLEQRFWAKVDKSAPDGCWEWTGHTTTGYGRIKINGRMAAAHRVLWEWVNGPIPDGMDLDHRCANRKCVNPSHLRPVTRSQNLQHLTGAYKGSSSGVRGVSWANRENAWAVQVILNRRHYWGGYHSTLEAAERAAKELRAQLHTHDDHDDWINKRGATK